MRRVSEKVLMARINRQLGPDSVLRKSRADIVELGEFFVVDVEHNCVVSHDVALEQLAGELGALQPGETI